MKPVDNQSLVRYIKRKRRPNNKTSTSSTTGKVLKGSNKRGSRKMKIRRRAAREDLKSYAIKGLGYMKAYNTTSGSLQSQVEVQLFWVAKETNNRASLVEPILIRWWSWRSWQCCRWLESCWLRSKDIMDEICRHLQNWNYLSLLTF